MDTLINFRPPRLDALDLKLLKEQCWYLRLRYSRLKGSRRMSTETIEALIEEVEALIEEVELLREDLVKVRYKLTHTKLAAHVSDKTEKELRTNLARAKLDAEIFEAMYDAKLAHNTKLETQLGSIKETVEWLWGFWDGNTLIAKPGYADDIRDAWDRLLGAIYMKET